MHSDIILDSIYLDLKQVGLGTHGWLFKYINSVILETLSMLANDPIKLNNSINSFLIN